MSKKNTAKRSAELPWMHSYCWLPSRCSHTPGKFHADVLTPYPVEEPLPGPGVANGSAPSPEAVAHTWGCNGRISLAELVSQVGTRAAPSCSSKFHHWGSVGASQQCVASAKDSRVAGGPPSVSVSVMDPRSCSGDAGSLAPGAGLTSLVVPERLRRIFLSIAGC